MGRRCARRSRIAACTNQNRRKPPPKGLDGPPVVVEPESPVVITPVTTVAPASRPEMTSVLVPSVMPKRAVTGWIMGFWAVPAGRKTVRVVTAAALLLPLRREPRSGSALHDLAGGTAVGVAELGEQGFQVVLGGGGSGGAVGAGRGGEGGQEELFWDAGAEGGVGDEEDVLALVDDDGDVGGHAGLELEGVVGDVDDGAVGDDALLDDGRVADLAHGAAEVAAGEGVDGEVDGLVDGDGADVGLGDGGLDLKAAEVVDQDEENGGVETGGDGLADGGLAVEHDAVDGGEDGAAGEVDLGVLDGGGADLELGLSLGELGEGLVEFLLRDEVALAQGLDALGVEFHEVVIGADVGELGLGLIEARGVGGGVDAREHVAGLHLGVVVDKHLLDEPGDLRTNLDLLDRLEIAGGGDGLRERAAGERRGLDLGRGLGTAAKEKIGTAAEREGDKDDGHETPGFFGHGGEMDWLEMRIEAAARGKPFRRTTRRMLGQTAATMPRFHGKTHPPALRASHSLAVLYGMKLTGCVLFLGVAAMLSAEPATKPAPATPPAEEPLTAATTDTGTVRKITANHGNLITTLRASDLAALGIEVGHIFTLRIGEQDHAVLYGQRYEDVPAGGWVAVAKDGDLIWIARNGANAAESAAAKVGTVVRAAPQR